MEKKSSHGGARKGAGRKAKPKNTPTVASTHLEKAQNLAQRGYDELDAIFDLLLERAKGVQVLVRPLKKGKNSIGEIVWLAESAHPGPHVCKSCGEVCEYDESEVWLVYQEPPNDQQLQFLYNQLLGKAAMKAQEVVIPEINVIFKSDIRCDPTSITPVIPQPEVEPAPVEKIDGPGYPTLGLLKR